MKFFLKPRPLFLVKWADESNVFLKQRKIIEDLEASEASLLETIVELKKDSPEAEYIAARCSCTQLIYMKYMLKEYNVQQDVKKLYCDNMSDISISKNLVQHSQTKHIDLRHHFIRDLVEDKIISLEDVNIENQLADIFTKTLDTAQSEKLKASLCMCILDL